jgi:hypothetical protein
MVSPAGFEPAFMLRSRLRHYLQIITWSEAVEKWVRLKHGGLLKWGTLEMGDVGSKATSGNPGRWDPGSVLPPALADGGQPRAVELRHRDA